LYDFQQSMITEQKIEKAVCEAIKTTITKFREHPYYFFTESDIHSYFYRCVYCKNFECVRNGKRIYLIHREYPTNFRYHKKDLPKPNCSEPIPLDKKEGVRGRYDLAVLHPKFAQQAPSCKDIVNKEVGLLGKRVKNLELTRTELLCAIEFKYIIKNAEGYVESIKADNKKLHFSKMCEQKSKHAFNLVFCNIPDGKYIEGAKRAISNAPSDVHAFFVQSYYDGNKKITPLPIEKKAEGTLCLL